MATYRLSFAEGLKLAEGVEKAGFDGQPTVDVELEHVLSCERLRPIEVEQKRTVEWMAVLVKDGPVVGESRR